MITAQDFLDNTIKLPSPPAVALKILDAVQKDEDGFEKLAKIISADPALAAQTLKIANSSLYQLQNKVSSLPQAVSLLGTQTLKNIALSFVIIDTFQDSPQGSFNLELFWKRAITTAVAAQILAREAGIKDDDIFVTALLQDLGLLVMFLSSPAAYTCILDNKRIHGKSISESEKEHFGFTHSEVGSHLFQAWGFPETIYKPIYYHHNTAPSPAWQGTASILNIADKISSIYHGWQSNKKYIEVHAILATQYGYESDKTREVIDLIGEKSIETMSIFALPPKGMKPFSQIMQEAKDKLGQLNYSYEQIVLELTQAKLNAELLAAELKLANDSLRELSFRDGLTNLYNHRYFQDFLESTVQRSIRDKSDVSLLMLDIDYFKDVNDTHGHPAGDHVLLEISTLLIQLVRQHDIVARYGGEEFAIILPETGIKSGKVLAQRLRRGIEQQKITHNNTEIAVTVSIGLSSTETRHEGRNNKTLINNADKALYLAKNNGRNRVDLYPEESN